MVNCGKPLENAYYVNIEILVPWVALRDKKNQENGWRKWTSWSFRCIIRSRQKYNNTPVFKAPMTKDSFFENQRKGNIIAPWKLYFAFANFAVSMNCISADLNVLIGVLRVVPYTHTDIHSWRWLAIFSCSVFKHEGGHLVSCGSIRGLKVKIKNE